MFTEFFIVFVKGRYTETTFVTYSTRAVATVLFTILVHFVLPKVSINNNKVFWGAIYIFYASTCGCWWIYELGQAELWSEGHIDAFLFYSIC